MNEPEQPSPPAGPSAVFASPIPDGSATQPQKGPFIRPGQRKPYVKATRKQIELRIEAAGLLCFCGFTKTQIHSIFRKRYGVEWRQTDRYLTRAHA